MKKAGPGRGTITSSPSGINCGAVCAAAFRDNQAVTLTARPGAGWAFNGWSGGCTGLASSCQVQMSQSRTVTATFSHATTTSLASSRNPSRTGHRVTYRAAVSPHPNGGTVRFTSGGRPISGCGAVAVNASTGKAVCSVTYRSKGTRRIRAVYSGNAGYARSTSSVLRQTVKGS